MREMHHIVCRALALLGALGHLGALQLRGAGNGPVLTSPERSLHEMRPPGDVQDNEAWADLVRDLGRGDVSRARDVVKALNGHDLDQRLIRGDPHARAILTVSAYTADFPRIAGRLFESGHATAELSNFIVRLTALHVLVHGRASEMPGRLAELAHDGRLAFPARLHAAATLSWPVEVLSTMPFPLPDAGPLRHQLRSFGQGEFGTVLFASLVSEGDFRSWSTTAVAFEEVAADLRKLAVIMSLSGAHELGESALSEVVGHLSGHRSAAASSLAEELRSFLAREGLEVGRSQIRRELQKLSRASEQWDLRAWSSVRVYRERILRDPPWAKEQLAQELAFIAEADKDRRGTALLVQAMLVWVCAGPNPPFRLLTREMNQAATPVARAMAAELYVRTLARVHLTGTPSAARGPFHFVEGIRQLRQLDECSFEAKLRLIALMSDDDRMDHVLLTTQGTLDTHVWHSLRTSARSWALELANAPGRPALPFSRPGTDAVNDLDFSQWLEVVGKELRALPPALIAPARDDWESREYRGRSFFRHIDGDLTRIGDDTDGEQKKGPLQKP